MGNDLPDFQSEIVSAAVEATSFRSGLDADKPASPAAGDIWLARDTYFLYVCFTAGSWEKVAKLYLPLAGGTMSGAIAMGGNKVTGLGAPASQNDALRYGQTEIRNAEIAAAAGILFSKLEATPALDSVVIKKDGSVAFTGDQSMGTKKLTNVAAPVATTDDARKSEVDTVDAKLDDISQAQPTRAIDTIYQNSTKIRVVTIYMAMGEDEGAKIQVGAASPPTTDVAGAYVNIGTTGEIGGSITAVILPNYYYRLATLSNSPLIVKWTEWDLF